MKVAIVHEMLVKLGGAEKVVEELLNIFPDADLFTLIYDEKKVGQVFPKNKVKVAGITQRIYKIFRNQRFCLPLMPRAVESLDLSDYDLVILSSSGFAHGVITKPETKHIVYYHSPARYLWDWTNEYKKSIGFNKGIKGYFLNKLFLRLRIWDVMASSRGDVLLANSSNVKKRIQKYYRRESEVVYPTVETNRFKDLGDSGYFIIISALTEFKRLDVAINAFNEMPDKKLKIVGGGDYEKHLKNLIKGDNIELTGPKYGDDLVELLGRSKGLIFPGEEDFGITPIEAMSALKPVFALNAGGLKETNIEGETGEFFDDKDGKDFVEKFIKFDEKINNDHYDKNFLKSHAESFSKEKFKENILKFVNEK